jgi:triacylglycerol lipase
LETNALFKNGNNGTEKSKRDFIKTLGVGKSALKKLLAITLLMSLLMGTAFSFPKAAAQEVVDYPYILVHGIGGWGRDEGINNTLPYWGATTGNLAEFLRGEGYTVYEASVGPLSSAWDRACELYAQLTGTRVDYGEAHSKANGHERYGREYSEPMFEGWGREENGQIKKIHLIGHSFGGLTIRLLASLLEYGAPEEIEISGEDVSPLFKGGQGHLVHSVTTLCSPNNGSTFVLAFENFNILEPFINLCIAYVIITGNSPLCGYVDFHLEQFGLSCVPGEDRSLLQILHDLALFKGTGTDNAAFDIFPGERDINNRIRYVDDIYYLSYSFSTTSENPYDKTHFPKSGTNPVLLIPAFIIGRYNRRTPSGEAFDSRWYANDGLVNVISARHPNGEPWQEYEGGRPVLGKWNVMPTRQGDHGTAIGLGADKDETHDFYLEMFELIESTR